MQINMKQKIMTSKQQPSWVEAREALRKQVEEPLVFIGELGADGVIDGKLPNGNEYEWYKRRPEPKK